MQRPLLIMNQLKLAVFLIPFLCFTKVGMAQYSFEEYLEEASLEELEDLAIRYLRSSLDSLERLCSLLIEKRTSEEEKSIQFLSKRYLGSCQLRRGHLKKSVKNFEECITYFEHRRLLKWSSEVRNELGNAFFLSGNLNSAAKSYLLSLKYGADSDDPTAAYNGMIGLGKVLCAQGDTSYGIQLISTFLENALVDHKYESAADACGFLAMIYGPADKELSGAYFKRSIDYASRSNSLTHKANLFANKAILEFSEGRLDNSLVHFHLSLKLRTEVGHKKAIAEGFFNLGIFHLDTGSPDSAQFYAEKSEELAERNGLLLDQIDALELLLEIHMKLGHENTRLLEHELSRLRELVEERKVNQEIIDLANRLNYPKPERFKAQKSSMLIPFVSLGGLVLFAGLFLFWERPKTSSV